MRLILAGGVVGSVVLLATGQGVVQTPPAGPLAPYILTSENGAYVDWLDGHVGVRGTTTISRRIAQNRVFYLQTKTSAEAQGHARMMTLIAGLPRDGRTLLGSDEALKTRIGERIGNEKAAEIMRDTGPIFEVLVKTPLWGPDSLIHLVLGEPVPVRTVPAITTAGVSVMPATTPGDGPTGLIVDARDLDGPAAALLPRILDEMGHLIHSLDSADPAEVRERGLVAYAVSPHGVNPVSGGLRQGDRPMMVKAVSSAGATRADLIIRQTDADRIAAAASAPAFLRECRVIILMSSPAPQTPRPVPHLTRGPERKPSAADPNLN